MTRTLACLSLSLLALLAHAGEVQFEAADGVTVYGDLYEADGADRDAPLILLFHQGGGDARGEYAPLVGRLNAAGYHALAIDQRVGGERFGGVNRTMAALGASELGYCEAYADLEGALRFVIAAGYSGPRVAWGSSYSAALVFRLAAQNPDAIDAVLAFSPASGEPMEGCRPEPWSERVRQPLLALRPQREMEVAYVPRQMALFRSHGHETHVADPGVHGSSMLNADRVGAATDATWAVVLDFLERSLARESRVTGTVTSALRRSP